MTPAATVDRDDPAHAGQAVYTRGFLSVYDAVVYGFNSPYLRSFVVARVNPLRFAKLGADEKADFDKTIDRMIEGAKKFDPSKIKAQDVAIAAAVGGSDGEVN